MGTRYGNEASAQWISHRALQAAARAYDGRGPSTSLLDAFLQTLGISDFRDSLSWIYGPQPRDIPSLCRVVSDCAVSGDPVACSLFEDAAAELVEGMIAAASRLRFEDSPIPVSYQGGIAEHCPLLITSMRQKLAEAMPRANVQAPRAKPVMGAYLLACNELAWKDHAAMMSEYLLEVITCSVEDAREAEWGGAGRLEGYPRSSSGWPDSFRPARPRHFGCRLDSNPRHDSRAKRLLRRDRRGTGPTLFPCWGDQRAFD